MSDISIRIREDSREVERLLAGLGRGADKVITRALNRVLTSVNRQALRSLSKDIGLPQKRIKPAVRADKANFRNKRAQVVATGARIPLIDFQAKQKPTGIVYKGQGGKRKRIDSAFLQTMQSGHRGVFKRQGSKREMRRGRYKGKYRQPIVERFGPSIPYVMVQRKVQKAMDEVAEDRWPIEVRQQLKYYLRYDRGRY